MSFGYALILAVGICAVAAALEGLCAGNKVKSFFASLKFPSYSAPLWVWSIIGGVYYLLFGFVVFRLLRLDSSALRSALITLVISMMIANGLTNYVIFRARNLRLSFLVGLVFPMLDIALFIGLVQLDQEVAWLLLPYLLYRVYAVWWGYKLWKLNSS